MASKELKEKYIEFLNSFDIAMSEDEINKRIKLDFKRPTYLHAYEDTPTRQTAIEAYLITCTDFGYPVSDNIKYMHESEIWDYALANINTEVRKRFGAQLSRVTDVIRRKHVKDAITALFDQRIYITSKQAEELIEAARDNDEIMEVYLSFGGEKTVFDPSVLYNDDEYLQDYYEEEEYEEDEDENEQDEEEVE